MLHVSATSPQMSTLKNRTQSTREIGRKEDYIHFEFLYINHSSRIENNTATTCYSNVWAHIASWKSISISPAGFCRKESRQLNLRQTVWGQQQHFNVITWRWDILSQRIGIFAVIVRNSLVVLIISISFLFPYVISIAYLPQGSTERIKKIAFFQ